jgi:hypothetical protein
MRKLRSCFRTFCTRFTLWFFCLLAGSPDGAAQKNCVTQNTAFAPGEELNYKVVYNWGMIWMESAEASFQVSRTVYNGKSCYLFRGAGSTYPKYDWFYKVRDVFEAHVDSESFRPLKFRADIHEGGKKDKHTYLFHPSKKKAYTIINRGSRPAETDTVSVTACTIDVLSAIYYARNIDYSACRVNDTVSISLLLDGQVHAIYVRYLGKEKFSSKELGTYDCIKFSPLLVEGSIFKKGEGMTVWVTDDRNKLPLYIETPIIVGMIKVKLMSYKGLRNPEEARRGAPE